MRDLQEENILSRYNLRQETVEKKRKREKTEEMMGYNSQRKINFPFYNMELTKT